MRKPRVVSTQFNVYYVDDKGNEHIKPFTYKKAADKCAESLSNVTTAYVQEVPQQLELPLEETNNGNS